MPRKGENIYKRKDGRWEGRYIKEYTLTGKPHWGYLYGKSYAEVKAKLKDQAIAMAISESRNSKIGVPYEIILSDWLKANKSAVKESTYARYDFLVHQHIVPVLGQYHVDKIGTQTVENYLSLLLSQGRLDGNGGLSPKTANDIFSIVKCSLAYAKDAGYCVFCNTAKLRIKQEPKEMRVLSVSEQRLLQSYLLTDTDAYKYAVLLCLFTGIRIGEVCALRWEHLNVEQGVLDVCKTMQRVKNTDGNKGTHIVVTSPKSKCSYRKIPLPAFLTALSKQFQGSPDAYILTNKSDKYVEPRVLQTRFKTYLKDCAIADANFHCLRHTFATRCVELGFDVKSLSEILGHANVNITLNRYVHSSLDLKAENMNKLMSVV